MTNAYNELYLDDAISNIGDIVEVAVCDLQFDINVIWGWSIISGGINKFGKGNIKYITGVYGFELDESILTEPNVSYDIFKQRTYTIKIVLLQMQQDYFCLQSTLEFAI